MGKFSNLNYRIEIDCMGKMNRLCLNASCSLGIGPVTDTSRFPPLERFAMGKESSEHILALDTSQHGDCPKFVYYASVARSVLLRV